MKETGTVTVDVTNFYPDEAMPVIGRLLQMAGINPKDCIQCEISAKPGEMLRIKACCVEAS